MSETPETVEEVPADPEPTDETVEPETVEEIPAELTRFLDEPDFDDEEEVDTTPVAEEEYFEDQDVDTLKRQLAKEQKRREHAEKLRVQSERKNWEEEGRKFFRYADVPNIKANSRRAFLRQARAEHEAIKTRVDVEVERERKQLAEVQAKLEQDGRDATRTAWGQPPTDEAAAKALADRTKQVYAELANRGGFEKSVKARMDDPNDPVAQAFHGMLGGVETRD